VRATRASSSERSEQRVDGATTRRAASQPSASWGGNTARTRGAWRGRGRPQNRQRGPNHCAKRLRNSSAAIAQGGERGVRRARDPAKWRRNQAGPKAARSLLFS
jgi:hypothetical protein